MAEKPIAWDELQMFLATARAGTLSGAARVLDTSPATLFRRLRVLDRNLKVELFSRSPRGYSLTPAGTELLAHVQAMEAEAMAAERRLGGRDQKLAGVVRVATLDDMVQTVLGPVLARFANRHPLVELDLVIGSEYTDLTRRAADVAIRAGGQPTQPEVIALSVCEIGVALYASREYLRRHPRPEGLKELAGHRVVRADQARCHLPMEKLIERHSAGSAIALRSNSMLARYVAVREGMGVGFLPCFAADWHSDLVRIGGVVPEASSTLWIQIHADMRRNARVRAFVDYTHAELMRLQGRFAGSDD